MPTKNETKQIAKNIRDIAKDAHPDDAKELRHLAVVVESGDMKKAWKTYKSMDTFNRDAITEENLEFLYINRTKGKKVISVTIKVNNDEILKGELIFPIDATDREIASNIMGWESEQRDELIQFDYGTIKKRKR
jgi:hypothetical protein